MTDPGDEIVAVVDEDNRVVGSAPRREMRARRLPHRSTYILVFNSRGEVYVQKRTMTKDVFPELLRSRGRRAWCWRARATSREPRRELEEEMGIRDVPLESLFEFYHADDHSRVWGAAYRCVYDGPVTLQEEEVESGAFMTVDAVFQAATTQPFTPDGLYVLRRYAETARG